MSLRKHFCQCFTSKLLKKQKFTKANNSNFETKKLRKAIMKVQNFEINISVKEETKRKVPSITKELST